MRFPTVFRRRVGEPATDTTTDRAVDAQLGSDKRPTGKPTKADNFHTSRLVNFNGFPAQRVCVGCVGPEDSLGRSVPIELWMYEERTDAWLRVPGDEEIRVGGIAYFDAPCLLDHGRGRSDDDSHNPGSLDVVLVAGKPGGPLAEGEYSFLCGTDVSNPGH